MPRQRVLIVDDQAEIRRGVRRLVEERGHEVETAETSESAYTLALGNPPDLLIADLSLPGESGMDLVSRLQDVGLDPTTIILTGHGTIDSAIEATRRGVYDYVLKPVRPKELGAIIAKALERASLREEVRLLRREMGRSGRFEDLVGRSAPMLELYRVIEQVAPSPTPVLITGESGTGKELVASAIHGLSGRAKAPLINVNCAAIPDELLESEMFGHEKGAFTGALQSRKGCFELAHGGTLFLDEIGDMPMRLQSKLLRVLENGTFHRVGGEREQKVDVRLITATNAPLEQRIAEGSFRQDLYFRINVFPIELPPLRDRVEDIPLLVERFCRMFADEHGTAPKVLSEDALDLLRAHDWPGNVRELRNVIQRASIVSVDGEITPATLPSTVAPKVPSISSDEGTLAIPLGTSIADVERELVLATLAAHKGNKTRTAHVLGISPKTLYAKLERYGAHKRGNEAS